MLYKVISFHSGFEKSVDWDVEIGFEKGNLALSAAHHIGIAFCARPWQTLGIPSLDAAMEELVVGSGTWTV